MPNSVLRILLVVALAWALPAKLATAAAEPRVRVDPTLDVSRTSAIAGERLRFTGRVPASRERAVALQAKLGAQWRTIRHGTTTATGWFTLKAASRPGTTTYRVRAKATSTAPAVATPVRKVVTTPQDGDLKLPAGAQVGQTRTGTATFTPARSGRPVELQVQQGDAWVVVASQPESGNGTVTFAIPTDQPGTFAYRAVATVFHGAEPAISPTQHFVVTGALAPQPAATNDTATAHISRPTAWARWTCSRSTVAASRTVNAG